MVPAYSYWSPVAACGDDSTTFEALYMAVSNGNVYI